MDDFFWEGWYQQCLCQCCCKCNTIVVVPNEGPGFHHQPNAPFLVIRRFSCFFEGELLSNLQGFFRSLCQKKKLQEMVKKKHVSLRQTKKTPIFVRRLPRSTRPNGVKPLGGWHRSTLLLGFAWHRSLIGLQATGSTGSASCDSQHVGEPEWWHHISPKGAVTDLVGCFFGCTRIYLCLMVPHFHVNLDHIMLHLLYKMMMCFVFFFSSYWNLLIFNRWGQQTTDTQSFLSKVKHLQQPVGPRRDRSEVESLKSRIRAAQEDFQWGGGVGEGFLLVPQKKQTRIFWFKKNIDVSLYYLTGIRYN